MEIAYLDNAATTKIRPEVLDILVESLRKNYANPSSTYSLGRNCKSKIELARKQIAKLIGVSSNEILFTSGGTESNNIILNSIVNDLQVNHIITSRIEHNAVINIIEHLGVNSNLKISYLPILESGDVDLTSLESVLTKSKDKICVSLMHCNNEIGSITNIDRIGELCNTYNAYFHSDIVQSVGNLKLQLNNSKVHFASASAHKFYGPKGVGFVVIKPNLGIKSLMQGGEQERGIRPGTEATPQIVAMAEALKLCYNNFEQEQLHIKDIKKYAVEQIKKNLPSCNFNAFTDKSNQRKNNIISVCLPVPIEKAQTILFQLDMKGVCCSLGSACQSGSNKPSHVLKEFLPEAKLKLTSIRFSFSIFTKKKEIDLMVRSISELI